MRVGRCPNATLTLANTAIHAYLRANVDGCGQKIDSEARRRFFEGASVDLAVSDVDKGGFQLADGTTNEATMSVPCE